MSTWVQQGHTGSDELLLLFYANNNNNLYFMLLLLIIVIIILCNCAYIFSQPYVNAIIQNANNVYNRF